MEFCPNHLEVEATIRCVACRKTFCPDCTIDFQGMAYCGACKNRAVRHQQYRSDFSLPREALIWSLVGLIPCLGLILSVVGIVRASQALSRISKDARLPGQGLAIAALVVGILGTLWGAFCVLILIVGLSAQR
jgi:hypothetical protein